MTGDSVYGSDHALRRLIERHGRGYVLAVTRAQRLGLKPVEGPPVPPGTGPCRDGAGACCAGWLEDVPARGWRRLSAGEGAMIGNADHPSPLGRGRQRPRGGPRLYDWAYLPCRGAASGWKAGLLVRRKIEKPGAPLAFYLTLAPGAAGLAELVRVAGTRWAIEACFEAAKGEVGLDQHEVRSWAGWYRHVALAMLAHACLAVVRQTAIGGIGPSRPRRRAAAPHRARGAAAARAPGGGATPRSTTRHRLVARAPTPPAARPTRALATTNQNA